MSPRLDGSICGSLKRGSSIESAKSGDACLNEWGGCAVVVGFTLFIDWQSESFAHLLVFCGRAQRTSLHLKQDPSFRSGFGPVDVIINGPGALGWVLR